MFSQKHCYPFIMEGSHQALFFALRTGRNVYRMLFKSKAYERNELFLPGRMAYVVDLDDEYADTDIPTTLIRSKADCPTMEVSHCSPESLTSLSYDSTLSLISQVLFISYLLSYTCSFT